MGEGLVTEKEFFQTLHRLYSSDMERLKFERELVGAPNALEHYMYILHEMNEVEQTEDCDCERRKRYFWR